MKHSYFLLVLFFGLFSAQKLKVVDFETGSPVSNARILLSHQIVYTNEDGFAPVNPDAANFEISASGFQKEKVRAFSPVIRLKPVYKDIGEIKIVDVDIKKLFQDVSKNYQKRYYNEPSLYDVVYKEKKSDNDKLYFLVIAEAKLWSKSNHYNYRDGIRRNYDEILQMQLNNVKYMRNMKSDSIFVAGTNEFSHEYMGNYFFSFELNRTLAHIKSKGSKYSGRLIFEEGDEQLISFKIQSGAGIGIKGEFKYNGTDQTITYFEIHYYQTQYPVMKRKTADGREYDYQLGDASLTFDFYKKDGMYVPALCKLDGEKYVAVYNGKRHERKFSREIIYNTFTKSDDQGLAAKVDFGKSIWENIPVKEEKDGTILLSEEEQAFINGK